jgi:hypothetical protein
LVDEVEPFRQPIVGAMPFSKTQTGIDAIDDIHGLPFLLARPARIQRGESEQKPAHASTGK